MAGYYHELETYVKGRGWRVDRCNGGHLKITHPKIPGPVFTSATPSDHRVVANVKAEIRRREKMAGLGLEPGEKSLGRHFTELFKQEIIGDWNIETIQCSKCPATATMRHGVGSVTTAAHVSARFRSMGWHARTHRRDDLCPDCRKGSAPEVAQITKAPEALPVSRISMPFIKLPEKPEITQINLEALNRQQLAQKRKIAAMLSKVYIADIGYLPGESDATVASKLGTSREMVEIVRRDFYGPVKQLTPAAMLKREVLAYKRDLKAFEQIVLEGLSKLEADGSKLLRWLDMIEENAIPQSPDVAPEEPELPLNGHHRNGAAA